MAAALAFTSWLLSLRGGVPASARSGASPCPGAQLSALGSMPRRGLLCLLAQACRPVSPPGPFWSAWRFATRVGLGEWEETWSLQIRLVPD